MKVYKPEGMMKPLSKDISYAELVALKQNGTIIAALTDSCDDQYNLHISIGERVKGIIPFEEFEMHREGKEVKKSAVTCRVSKMTCGKITDVTQVIDENGNELINIVVSRKQAQEDCMENFVSKLELGKVIDARITYIEEYGLFCDIGCGISALLPLKHFSVPRITEPKKSLRQYKNLKVVVKSIEGDRIGLSQKELLGTWEEEVENIKIGDILTGKVTGVASYGVFVQLSGNLSALADYIPGIEVDKWVKVYVKSIIPEKSKIKLDILEYNLDCDSPIRLQYRIPKSGYVRYWVYSRENLEKVIETRIE